MPGPPAVLNSPLTGVKSAPALILIAFGWAGSFPGSARVSLKVTNGQILTFSLRNPTQVFKGSSFFLLWNHGRTHKSYRVLSEGDGTSWETTFEQHSSALLVADVQLPGTQSWTEQLRIKRETLKLTCPSPWSRQSCLCQTKQNQVVIYQFLRLISAVVKQHKTDTLVPPPPPLPMLLPPNFVLDSMIFDRHFSLGHPWREFWIGFFLTAEQRVSHFGLWGNCGGMKPEAVPGTGK